jgi:hypothetical protein
MQTVNINEAKTHLSRLVDEVINTSGHMDGKGVHFQER